MCKYLHAEVLQSSYVYAIATLGTSEMEIVHVMQHLGVHEHICNKLYKAILSFNSSQPTAECMHQENGTSLV